MPIPLADHRKFPVFNNLFQRSLTEHDIKNIAHALENGQEELGTFSLVWEKIKDMFCQTKVCEAKQALFILLNGKSTDVEKFSAFLRLEELADSRYRESAFCVTQKRCFRIADDRYKLEIKMENDTIFSTELQEETLGNYDSRQVKEIYKVWTQIANAFSAANQTVAKTYAFDFVVSCGEYNANGCKKTDEKNIEKIANAFIRLRNLAEPVSRLRFVFGIANTNKQNTKKITINGDNENAQFECVLNYDFNDEHINKIDQDSKLFDGSKRLWSKIGKWYRQADKGSVLEQIFIFMNTEADISDRIAAFNSLQDLADKNVRLDFCLNADNDECKFTITSGAETISVTAKVRTQV